MRACWGGCSMAGRPADDRPTTGGRRGAGHPHGAARRCRRPRVHLRQGRNPADLELPGEGLAPCGSRGWAGAAASARPSAHRGSAVDRGRREPQGGQLARRAHVGQHHAGPLRPPVRGPRPCVARPARRHAARRAEGGCYGVRGAAPLGDPLPRRRPRDGPGQPKQRRRPGIIPGSTCGFGGCAARDSNPEPLP